MSTHNTSVSPSLVPAIARRERPAGPNLLSAILSKWPLIWTRGSPHEVESLPNHLRQDIGLPPAVPQRSHWDYMR